jgi:dipeptidyl aminopeptidase/acylaminoacyl peptidase
MGGTVVANCLEKSVKAIVFWYPAFNFLNSDFTEIFFNPEVEDSLEKRGYYYFDGFKVGKKFIEQINSINVFKKVREISCPTFFLHGNKDREVPYQESQKAYRMI